MRLNRYAGPTQSVEVTSSAPSGTPALSDSAPGPSRWLHRYAVLTALATLGLIGVGGLVTSHGAGLAVPDWPTTYGYNMFFFPISKWVGGILYEHTHRLVATLVGLLVVGLTRWLGGRSARLPLAIIGLAELAAGVLLLRLGPSWQGAGHFLSGIGGVVLLAAAVWARNAPAAAPLPFCGWLAFGLVQVQGLLGGLRVVLFKDELGILHGALAQLFFALLCAVVLLTSRGWRRIISVAAYRRVPVLLQGATFLVLVQLILGATMRHQHAGLAIPDFPLAYGRLWPAMDAGSVAQYNQHRIEITAVNPITAVQIALQMTHRLLALLILVVVGLGAWKARITLGRYHHLTRLTSGWFGLILAQALLGAATIWSNKAADIATLHVLTGALSLATGFILCLIASRGAVLGTVPPRSAAGVTLSPLHAEPAAPRM